MIKLSKSSICCLFTFNCLFTISCLFTFDRFSCVNLYLGIISSVNLYLGTFSYVNWDKYFFLMEEMKSNSKIRLEPRLAGKKHYFFFMIVRMLHCYFLPNAHAPNEASEFFSSLKKYRVFSRKILVTFTIIMLLRHLFCYVLIHNIFKISQAYID